jgi:hypothetical protein
MTSFFQTTARNPLSTAALTGAARPAARTSLGARFMDDEAEYHVIFATMTAFLIGGSAVILAALSHAI